MSATITFETQCYENDYDYVLNIERLRTAITNCNVNFSKKVVLINKVFNRKKVTALAEQCKQSGVIDAYYFADDYVAQALHFFKIDPNSFTTGYYVSRCQLIGLFLCDTDYLLHFTADSHIEQKNDSRWIEEAIQLMETNPRYITASPYWYNDLRGAQLESVAELEQFFLGYGFSDNCYLVPTKLFKTNIYNEFNQASQRYPGYAGECFEKRVDSYMRNHDLLRLVSKEICYVHTHFPRKRAVQIRNFLEAKTIGLYKRIMRRLTRKPRISIPALPQKYYDVVLFSGELDWLMLRLNMLESRVDYFVIVEAKTKNAQGVERLIYKENEHLFGKFQHKIIYYVIDDLPRGLEDLQQRLDTTQLNPVERSVVASCLIEGEGLGQDDLIKFYQIESIRKALVDLNNDDICFVSLDSELWNPSLKLDARRDDVFRLLQVVCVNNFEGQTKEISAGTIVTKYKNIKHNCLNGLLNAKKTRFTLVKNGGWKLVKRDQAEREELG